MTNFNEDQREEKYISSVVVVVLQAFLETLKCLLGVHNKLSLVKPQHGVV